jgi:septum site-determining protein MinD
MPTVYAVASAKGGVGKTTTAAGLATALAAAGESVVVVDGDVGSPALADTLGVSPGAVTLHDVLAGRAEPAAAVVDGPTGLRVVPGDPSLEAFAAADPAGLEAVVTAFEDASSVVVDTSAGLTHATARVLALADETLLVTTSDPRAVTATEKTRALTTRLGGHVAGTVLVRAGNEDEDGETAESGGDSETAESGGDSETAESRSLEGLETPVLARVPEDSTVDAAVTAGESLVAFDPSAPASVAYRRLAATLTGREAVTESVHSGASEGSVDDDSSEVPTDGPDARPNDDSSEPMSTALTGSTDASASADDESGGQAHGENGRGGLLSQLFGR